MTAGLEIGWKVEAEGKLPLLGGGSVSKKVKVSVSGSKGGESSTTLKFRSGYTVPVRPQEESDVQLQVIEQVIEGTPFEFSAELIGDTVIQQEQSGY